MRRNKNYSFIKFMTFRLDVNYSVAMVTTVTTALELFPHGNPGGEGRDMELDSISHITPSFVVERKG